MREIAHGCEYDKQRTMMTLTEFSLIFTLGLVSSLHCIQMCGPLVISLSLPLSSQSVQQQMLAQLSYHLGRLVTYTLLGAVAGLAGQTVGFIGQLAGVQNLLAIATGIMMLLAALFMLDVLSSQSLQKFDPLRWLSGVFKPVGKRLAAPTVSSKFGLGLMLGLLPCGLVYAAMLKAMATGTALAGAMTMTAFGAGTMSALLALGYFSTFFSRQFARQFGQWGSRLAAVSVALLGAVLIWRGVMPWFGGSSDHAPSCHQAH